MGRKPKRKEKSTAEIATREEFEHRLCYAYVECGSYGAVAKQFGTHSQTVKRAWLKLTDEQQQSIRDAHARTSQNLQHKLRRSIFKSEPEATAGLTRDDIIEGLNRQTMRAEALVSAEFVDNVIESRKLLGQELRRRCGDEMRLANMSDKDFATLFRLVASTFENPDDKGADTPEQGSTLKRLRMSIEQEIYQTNT